MQFLRTLANASAFTATAGSDVTASFFVTGALPELSIALVKGNEVRYWKALHVYATAGGMAVRRHAHVPRCLQWPLSSVVVVCSIVAPNA
jgi:hypothetical protein